MTPLPSGNNIGLAAMGRTHFYEDFVRQTDRRRTGLGNKAFSDADFIGAVRLDDADFLISHDDRIIARLGTNRKRIRTVMI